jgi:hypothetical protein
MMRYHVVYFYLYLLISRTVTALTILVTLENKCLKQKKKKKKKKKGFFVCIIRNSINKISWII